MERQSTHLIHNERVTLTATWLNNMGVGALVTGVIAPIAAGWEGITVFAGVVTAGAISVGLNRAGSYFLGKLRE